MNEEVLQRIDALAEKLGVVSEHLWGVLVRQAYVEAVIAAFILLATAAAWVLVVRTYRSHKAEDQYFDIEDHPALTIGSIILAIVSVVVILVCPEIILTALINPEYAALRKILP